MNKNLIVSFTLIISSITISFCQNSCIKDSIDYKIIDSLLTNYKDYVKPIYKDDSTQWRIIAGEKLYARRRVNVQVYFDRDFYPLFKNFSKNDTLCNLKKFAFAFDKYLDLDINFKDTSYSRFAYYHNIPTEFVHNLDKIDELNELYKLYNAQFPREWKTSKIIKNIIYNSCFKYPKSVEKFMVHGLNGIRKN